MDVGLILYAGQKREAAERRSKFCWALQESLAKGGGEVRRASESTGLYFDAIRDEEVKVFRTILPLDPMNLVRGQFKDYKSEKGVPADSTMETLRLFAWKFNLGAGPACHF